MGGALGFGGPAARENRNHAISQNVANTKSVIDFFGQQGLSAPFASGGSNSQTGFHGQFSTPQALVSGGQFDRDFQASKGSLDRFISGQGRETAVDQIFRNSNLDKATIRTQLTDLGQGGSTPSVNASKTAPKTADPPAPTALAATTPTVVAGKESKKKGRKSPTLLGLTDSGRSKASLIGL
jgi:hypothetical protein